MAVILFMGKTSDLHGNAAVTLGFALRKDFPLKRVPG
jgi:aquaporin Z